MPLAGGQVKRKVCITLAEKRRRAAALQNAGALPGDSRTARSVLECASPLALWEGRWLRAGDGKKARGGKLFFYSHFIGNSWIDFFQSQSSTVSNRLIFVLKQIY